MISWVVNALRDQNVYYTFRDKNQTRRLPGEISSFLTLLSKRVEIKMSCQNVHLALQVATYGHTELQDDVLRGYNVSNEKSTQKKLVKNPSVNVVPLMRNKMYTSQGKTAFPHTRVMARH